MAAVMRRRLPRRRVWRLSRRLLRRLSRRLLRRLARRLLRLATAGAAGTGAGAAAGAAGAGVGASGLGCISQPCLIYYTTYYWGGVPYYYADNTYYTWDPNANQYVTVAPPAGLQAQVAGARRLARAVSGRDSGHRSDRLPEERAELPTSRRRTSSTAISGRLARAALTRAWAPRRRQASATTTCVLRRPAWKGAATACNSAPGSLSDRLPTRRV